MRIWTMMVMIVFLMKMPAMAATVVLTDGRIVQGDIVKQDNKSIQVNVDGVTMTYYSDEIKEIDGKPLNSQPAPPAAGESAPAPAVPGQVSGTPEGTAAQASLNTAGLVESPSAYIDPEKKALILKFIDVFGTHQALVNNFELMLQQVEKEKPAEARKIRERVKIDEIIDRLLPVYDRNFSTSDLKAFVAFYGSAEGRKLVNTIPELMKESVQESIKYMKEKFPEAGQ